MYSKYFLQGLLRIKSLIMIIIIDFVNKKKVELFNFYLICFFVKDNYFYN